MHERLYHVETRMNKGVGGHQEVINNCSKWKCGFNANQREDVDNLGLREGSAQRCAQLVDDARFHLTGIEVVGRPRPRQGIRGGAAQRRVSPGVD